MICDVIATGVSIIFHRRVPQSEAAAGLHTPISTKSNDDVESILACFLTQLPAAYRTFAIRISTKSHRGMLFDGIATGVSNFGCSNIDEE